MDLNIFFNSVRSSLFRGVLTQPQVDGMLSLVNRGLNQNIDLRWIAYILGTSYHETARTMQPIEEYGRGAGRPYGRPDPETGKTYYGRGFVQLTWKANYAEMSRKVNVDLVRQPELALDIQIATEIIYVGMIDGTFTRGTYKLPMFFTRTGSDWYNARRIVNGLDKAGPIANYALAFYKAELLAVGQQPQYLGPRDFEEEVVLADEDYVEAEKAAVAAYPDQVL